MQITVKICVDCISSITKFAIYKSALLLFCNCIMKENSAVYFREESCTFYEKLRRCCFVVFQFPIYFQHTVSIHTSLLFGIDKYTHVNELLIYKPGKATFSFQAIKLIKNIYLRSIISLNEIKNNCFLFYGSMSRHLLSFSRYIFHVDSCAKSYI